MSAAERVRAAFKAAGFTTRHVTVASPRGDVRVTVRSLLVPFAWAKAVAKQVENVRHCEHSGEILLGGNTFVHVVHSEAAERELVARHMAAVMATAQKVMDAAQDGSGYAVEGTTGTDGKPAAITYNARGPWLRVHDGQYGACDYFPGDLPGIAYRLALLDPDQSSVMLPVQEVARG